MNKVELAYFQRPKDGQIVLSDRDACRLMKGQIVPNINLKINDSTSALPSVKIPKECRIQINNDGAAYPPPFNYDDDT